MDNKKRISAIKGRLIPWT